MELGASSCSVDVLILLSLASQHLTLFYIQCLGDREHIPNIATRRQIQVLEDDGRMNSN